jgi:perosamine synthetase
VSSERVRPGREKGGEPMRLPSDQDASGRTFGAEELAALARVLERGTLVSTKGPEVKAFEQRFATSIGSAHACASSSGTAAIHAAIAAIDPEPGDEIVTTAITDMGALTPILYQGAIPVFADVDPDTCNVTAAGIEAAISDRTKAIIATHLFGNPCDMAAIMEVADRHGLPVIEDCAQAFLATSAGRSVGTVGRFGAFSFQQGKHITSGEGGITVCNDPADARRVYLWVNKGYGYGAEKPDHEFVALNARMTELHGALLSAQMERLAGVVAARRTQAAALTELIGDIDGIRPPKVRAGDEHSYWKYCLTVDHERIPGGPVALGAALGRLGVASAPRYIQKPAFECTVFTEQRTFGRSRWPFSIARPGALDASRDRLPGTYSALEQVLVLPWNERYTDEHVAFLSASLHAAVAGATGAATGGAA